MRSLNPLLDCPTLTDKNFIEQLYKIDTDISDNKLHNFSVYIFSGVIIWTHDSFYGSRSHICDHSMDNSSNEDFWVMCTAVGTVHFTTAVYIATTKVEQATQLPRV